LSFFLAALVGSKSIITSVVTLRLIMISADVGIWWIGRKLLRHLGVSERCIYFYLLNPFVILEFTGNLHFEGVMIFFLLWAIYLLLTQKWVWSAVVLGLSISVKLIPLIFLPLFFKKLGFRRAVLYYLLTGVTVALLFAPFVSQALVANFMSSIELYFQNFEFNASVYYIVRAIGYEVTGYNIIQMAGRILPLVTLTAILVLSFARKNERSNVLMTSMLWAITIYYALSTTVHPWYIAVPLALSVLSGYRYTVAWSGLVVLSYAAYRQADYQENLWLIALEYCVVLGVLVYELRKGVKPPLPVKSLAHV
ncbi:MAG: glycosyltransferase 87 family protein, partial [Owenweeksia sp.]